MQYLSYENVSYNSETSDICIHIYQDIFICFGEYCILLKFDSNFLKLLAYHFLFRIIFRPCRKELIM